MLSDDQTPQLALDARGLRLLHMFPSTFRPSPVNVGRVHGAEHRYVCVEGPRGGSSHNTPQGRRRYQEAAGRHPRDGVAGCEVDLG